MLEIGFKYNSAQLEKLQTWKNSIELFQRGNKSTTTENSAHKSQGEAVDFHLKRVANEITKSEMFFLWSLKDIP